MGKINTSKIIFNKDYPTPVSDKREEMRSLYGTAKHIIHTSQRAKVKLCTLRPTPIRSK